MKGGKIYPEINNILLMQREEGFTYIYIYTNYYYYYYSHIHIQIAII